MSAINLIFAYSQENTTLIQNIEQELSSYLDPISHISGGRTTAAPSISEQVQNQPGQVILYISDNFLKSAQCMSNALRMLQKRGTDILPVIIPGRYKDEESGETNQVETSFDRVSDIIQYINYWQDRYLDLRRQKRQLEEEIDEEKFNEHLKKMREISSEVGEFLRLLRTTEYITYQEFIHNDYEALFSFIGQLDARDEYRKNRSGFSTPSEQQSEPEEEKTDHPSEDSQEEDLDLVLDDIPGIDLLTNVEQDEEGEQDEEELISDASDLYQHFPEDFVQDPQEKSETDDLVEEEVEEGQGEIGEEVELGEGEEEHVARNFFPEENIPDEEDEPDEDEQMEDEHVLEDVIAMIEEAFSMLENGHISGGMEHFSKALSTHYSDANLRYQFAIALVRYKKDFQNALVQLHEAIQIDPKFEDAHFLLGELAEITEDFSGARQAYKALAKINPEYPKVQFRLGIVLANHFEGKEKEATKALKLAIKQNPDNSDALYQYAVLLNEHLSKPKKALKYFKATLAETPDHPFAWYDIALLYHSQNQRKKAHKAYLKAVKINPELKTEENDQAFQVLDKKKKKELEEIADSFREKNTIDALKENIQQLEALLQAREEELKAETLVVEEDSSPLRVGQGKTVFISGATAGIGRATAKLFAQNGYKLILNGRRVDRLAAMKEEFEVEFGIDVKVLPFDIRNVQAVRDAVNGLENEWHPIDILVNNAGMAKGYAPIHEAETDHWEEMIDTNLKGLLYLTRVVSPFMVARGTGHIINVSSIVGKEVYPNGNVYCATKHAVDALTRAMRLDFLKHGIKVSQVSPGAVEETEFAMVRYEGDAERAAKTYENFKPLTSHDVAEAIYFIANQPPHVNIQDILMMGTQQASSTFINRSGREQYEEE